MASFNPPTPENPVNLPWPIGNMPSFPGGVNVPPAGRPPIGSPMPGLDPWQGQTPVNGSVTPDVYTLPNGWVYNWTTQQAYDGSGTPIPFGQFVQSLMSNVGPPAGSGESPQPLQPWAKEFFDTYYYRTGNTPYEGYRPPRNGNPPMPEPGPVKDTGQTPISGGVPTQPGQQPPTTPPTTQPPTTPPAQQQGIAGLKNLTKRQKEFLDAHPEWRSANVIRVDARNTQKTGNPYMQWLYNADTGEFLTATRGALKADQLSQGTRDHFATLDSVKQYMGQPGQPPTTPPTETPPGETPPPAAGNQAPPWWKPEWDNLKYYRVNDDGSVTVHQWRGTDYYSNFQESGLGAGRQLFVLNADGTPANPPRYVEGGEGGKYFLADVGAAWADWEARTKKTRPASWQELKGAPVNYMAGAPQGGAGGATSRDWNQPPPQGWGSEKGPNATQPPAGQPTTTQPAETKNEKAVTTESMNTWQDWLQRRLAFGAAFGQSAQQVFDSLDPKVKAELQRQNINLPGIKTETAQPIQGEQLAYSKTMPGPGVSAEDLEKYQQQQKDAEQYAPGGAKYQNFWNLTPEEQQKALGQRASDADIAAAEKAGQAQLAGMSDADRQAFMARLADPRNMVKPQTDAEQLAAWQNRSTTGTGSQPTTQANPWAALLTALMGNQTKPTTTATTPSTTTNTTNTTNTTTGTGNQIGGAGGVPTAQPNLWAALLQMLSGAGIDPLNPEGGTGNTQPPGNMNTSSFPGPTDWDSFYKMFTEMVPQGQTPGGPNGEYRITDPKSGTIPNVDGFDWTKFAEGDENQQNWFNLYLQMLAQQRSGTEWNQQFTENNRLNNARMMMDMAAMSWEQQAAQAKFEEDKRQFGEDYALREAQVKGYYPDADGKLQPTKERMDAVSANFASRGYAQVLDPKTGLPTGELANTLDQNKFIADAYGGGIDPKTGEWRTTTEMKGFIQGLEESAGNVPVWDYAKNDWARNPDGSVMVAPTFEKTKALMDTLGYRTNPETGQKEYTLEAKWQDIQAAIARAQQTGTFVDPVTNETSQTLEYYRDKYAQAMDVAAATGTFTDPITGQSQTTTAEEQRRFENLLSEAGLTGMYKGQETVAEQQRKYENLLNKQKLYSDILSQTGSIYDPYSNEKVETLESKQQAWSQAFQQSEADRANKQRQMEMLGYDPTVTSNVYGTGTSGTGTGGQGTGTGDYTPGGGQGGTLDQGSGSYTNQTGQGGTPQTTFANPWERPGLTQSMQAQLWQQGYQFPEQQKTEKRGQNFAAFGRTSRPNSAWS